MATSVSTNGKCNIVSISKIVTKKCVWMSWDFTPGLRKGLRSFIFNLQMKILHTCAWTLAVINIKTEYPSITISLVAQSNIGKRFWRCFACWDYNPR